MFRVKVTRTPDDAKGAAGFKRASYEIWVTCKLCPADFEALYRRFPGFSREVRRMVAMTLTDSGPARLDGVPVRESDGVRYVRFAEIPEPARWDFIETLADRPQPVVFGEPDFDGCAYETDWLEFVAGTRTPQPATGRSGEVPSGRGKGVL